jgi:uncharacterized membrane protein
MIAPGEIKTNKVNPQILAHFYLGHKNLDGFFMCNVGLFYIPCITIFIVVVFLIIIIFKLI